MGVFTRHRDGYVLSILLGKWGMTKQDLANNMNVSRTAVHQYTKSENVRVKTKHKIAKALGRSLEDLMAEWQELVGDDSIPEETFKQFVHGRKSSGNKIEVFHGIEPLPEHLPLEREIQIRLLEVQSKLLELTKEVASIVQKLNSLQK